MRTGTQTSGNNDQPELENKEATTTLFLNLPPIAPLYRQRAATPSEQKTVETVYESKDGNHIIRDRGDLDEQELIDRGFRKIR
jgi:hypothetical protein